MGKIYFITGGAKNGKSEWASSFFEQYENVLYVTSGERIQEDVKAKIEVKNESRTEKWTILAHSGSPVEILDEKHKYIIYDSIAGYVALKLYQLIKDPDKIIREQVKFVKKQVVTDVKEMLEKFVELDINIIILTNETGFSVLPDSKYQLAFRDIVGAANQVIGKVSDEAYLSVSGIQVKIK